LRGKHSTLRIHSWLPHGALNGSDGWTHNLIESDARAAVDHDDGLPGECRFAAHAGVARVSIRMDERSVREFGRRILRLVSATPAGDLPLDRLVVKSGGSTRFVRVADIDWIEAVGVYANLHIGGKELLYRAALNELAERLDPVRFVRVHRSAIVNIESILHLEPISHGEFEVILKDGSRLRISRTFRGQLEKRMGQSL
jgi:two-component system, LytTR family, response regulator